MFEDSLLESGNRVGRAKASAMSFAAQAVFICLLIILPLIYTDVLPAFQLMGHVITPAPVVQSAPRAVEHAVRVIRSESEIVDGKVRAPSRIPEHPRMISESEPPAPLISSLTGSGSARGGGDPIVLPGNSRPWTPPLPQAPPSKVCVSSGVIEGLLVRRVTPDYPKLAQIAGVQGAVVLEAVISKQGGIENLRVVSGHPMLIRPAMEAVKQWRYKPYVLNGEPVEVETVVTVNFKLAGR